MSLEPSYLGPGQRDGLGCRLIPQGYLLDFKGDCSRQECHLAYVSSGMVDWFYSA